MFRAFLIDREVRSTNALADKLANFNPSVLVCGTFTCISQAQLAFDDFHPNLLFIEAESSILSWFDYFSKFRIKNCEIIVISSVKDHAHMAINYQVSGYILKPFSDFELELVINNAIQRILINNKRVDSLLRKIDKSIYQNELLGIPTIEGFEFLEVGDIIRCEGLQKCTRIFTKNRTDIVSSYNIGEFKKILEPFGFFSPHKSHLINLSFIRKYHKEGTIMMADKSFVPVAKRKKYEFLEHMKHFLCPKKGRN